MQDYGAKGDGVTDDTAAINAAIQTGRTSQFTTKDPAVVYLPPGTYLVSSTITLWFYTHLVGNFKCRPTILLAPNSFKNGRTFVISGGSTVTLQTRLLLQGCCGCFVLSGAGHTTVEHERL